MNEVWFKKTFVDEHGVTYVGGGRTKQEAIKNLLIVAGNKITEKNAHEVKHDATLSELSDESQ